MKAGRILFRVDIGYGTLAKIQQWTVTSIRRRPRWGSFREFIPLRPVTVYLKTGKGRRGRWDGERDTFRLEHWPYQTEYAATERAAWKKAILRIEALIKREKEGLEEALADPCVDPKVQDEVVKEYKTDLRMARRSLTLALKKVKQ